MNYEAYTVDDFLLDDRFAAYCSGNDPAANAFWEHWQQSKPPNLQAFHEAKRLFALLSVNKPRLDESLLELESLIRQQSQPVKVVTLPPRASTFNRWVAAASLVLLAGAGWMGYQWWLNQYITHRTAYNQQSTVELPDGSTVVLNSHSQLRYRRNDFSDSGRQVELQGEVHFTVRHLTTDAPFRVKTTGAFDVQVLGTEFTVYERPALHRVVLNAGRVAVEFHAKQPTVMLKPGQMLEVGKKKQASVLKSVRADQYNAWMNHRFVFNQTTLTEVTQTVMEQFGVRVQLEGADPDLTFTGILPMNRPETVLTAIAELHQLTLRKTSNGYVLSK